MKHAWRRWRLPDEEKPARDLSEILSIPTPVSVVVEGEFGGTVYCCWYDYMGDLWHLVDYPGDAPKDMGAPDRWRYLERRDAKAARGRKWRD